MTIRRFRTLRNAGVTGFSAIELAIALAIVGILTAVAYPSYQLQIAKGRRADGTTSLLDLANRMQRYSSENNTFASATIAAGIATTDVLSSSTSPQGYYTLSVTQQSANLFTIKATRAGAQVADSRCGDLTLTSTNVRDITNNAAGVVWSQCW